MRSIFSSVGFVGNTGPAGFSILLREIINHVNAVD
jgi:hypothetical protein